MSTGLMDQIVLYFHCKEFLYSITYKPETLAYFGYLIAIKMMVEVTFKPHTS